MLGVLVHPGGTPAPASVAPHLGSTQPLPLRHLPPYGSLSVGADAFVPLSAATAAAAARERSLAAERARHLAALDGVVDLYESCVAGLRAEYAAALARQREAHVSDRLSLERELDAAAEQLAAATAALDDARAAADREVAAVRGQLDAQVAAAAAAAADAVAASAASERRAHQAAVDAAARAAALEARAAAALHDVAPMLLTAPPAPTDAPPPAVVRASRGEEEGEGGLRSANAALAEQVDALRAQLAAALAVPARGAGPADLPHERVALDLGAAGELAAALEGLRALSPTAGDGGARSPSPEAAVKAAAEAGAQAAVDSSLQSDDDNDDVGEAPGPASGEPAPTAAVAAAVGSPAAPPAHPGALPRHSVAGAPSPAAPPPPTLPARGKPPQKAAPPSESAVVKELRARVRALEAAGGGAAGNGGGGGAIDERALKEALERSRAVLERKWGKERDEAAREHKREVDAAARRAAKAGAELADALAALASAEAQREELSRRLAGAGALEGEVARLRSEAARAEELARELAGAQARGAALEAQAREEGALRKRYWNMLEDMKGGWVGRGRGRSARARACVRVQALPIASPTPPLRHPSPGPRREDPRLLPRPPPQRRRGRARRWRSGGLPRRVHHRDGRPARGPGGQGVCV